MMDPAMADRIQRLLQEACESVTWSRRLRRLGRRRRGPLAGGSHDDVERALAARVRAALRTGALALTANRAYGGRGAGETCTVCGEPISARQILYEVLEPRHAQAHLECYQIWQAESLRFHQRGPARRGPRDAV